MLYQPHLPTIFQHHGMGDDQPAQVFHFLGRLVNFFQVVVRNGYKGGRLDRFYKILRGRTAVKRFLGMNNMALKRKLCIDFLHPFFVKFSDQPPQYKIKILFGFTRSRDNVSFAETPDLNVWENKFLVFFVA